MKSIILSQFIENSLEGLGFSNIKNKEIIRYFLSKNIFTLFGKDNFETYEIEIKTIAEQEQDFTTDITKKSKRNKLQILYGDTKYIISSCEEDHALIMSDANSLMGFKMIITEDKVYNSNTTISEIETVNTFSCIYLKENPYFDYQNIIYNTESEEFIYPAYRAKPIFAKKGENQLFEVIKLENLNLGNDKEIKTKSTYETIKQYLIRYIEILRNKSEIIAIPFVGTDLNSYDNLDAVFRILEEKTEELPQVRKRVKE